MQMRAKSVALDDDIGLEQKGTVCRSDYGDASVDLRSCGLPGGATTLSFLTNSGAPFFAGKVFERQRAPETSSVARRH
jgi:hypothetical protein